MAETSREGLGEKVRRQRDERYWGRKIGTEGEKNKLMSRDGEKNE